MKKPLAFLFFLLPAILFAQESNHEPPKYALVIGNGAYRNLGRLANPVNDANDMAAVLEYLGFTVDRVLNGSLEQMESAVTRLKDRLKESDDAYGFFFFAGHGVQLGGENYLIPVNANIPSEGYLRNRALSVQVILNDLNEAGNSLNVIVLDACRDNPFGWSRGSNRGLAFVTHQPADSIIVYATSAGQTAADGDGRNGLFTSQLLPNLLTPGLEVSEVFRRTGADVSRESGNRQIPAVYSQFFGTAWLGLQPDETGTVPTAPTFTWPHHGSSRINFDEAKLWTLGASVGSTFSAPWFVGTVRGTVAPFKYSFLEIGFDFGTISGVSDVGYYSLFPFIHYAYYLPFTVPVGKNGLNSGWYIGTGGGYKFGELDYPEGKVPLKEFTVNIITGLNIGNVLDISYTLRTDFSETNNKFAIGYTYRFR